MTATNTPNGSLSRLLLSELLDMAAGLATLKVHNDHLRAQMAAMEARITAQDQIIATLSAALWSNETNTSTAIKPGLLRSLYSTAKEWVERIAFLHKAWVLWRAVRIPTGIASYGYLVLRWLGWL